MSISLGTGIAYRRCCTLLERLPGYELVTTLDNVMYIKRVDNEIVDILCLVGEHAYAGNGIDGLSLLADYVEDKLNQSTRDDHVR
jgi:hypothetical protein